MLVHCMSGTSRSASVVIGYLMYSRRWRLRQCYEWVAARHPATQLQPHASRQLQQLESELFQHDPPEPPAFAHSPASLTNELPPIGSFGTLEQHEHVQSCQQHHQQQQCLFASNPSTSTSSADAPSMQWSSPSTQGFVFGPSTHNPFCSSSS